MAGPHVAGAAALYLGAHPGASPQEVAKALVEAATAMSFDSRSPAALLNVMPDRLGTAPGPEPTDPATPAPETPVPGTPVPETPAPSRPPVVTPAPTPTPTPLPEKSGPRPVIIPG